MRDRWPSCLISPSWISNLHELPRHRALWRRRDFLENSGNGNRPRPPGNETKILPTIDAEFVEIRAIARCVRFILSKFASPCLRGVVGSGGFKTDESSK